MPNVAPFVAPPLRRLAGGFIDLVLALMLAGFAAMLASAMGIDPGGAELALTVYAMYHAAFYWWWEGQTPGMRIFDIRTVSAVGGVELSMPQVLLRAAVRPVLLYAVGSVAVSTLVPIGLMGVIMLAPVSVELGMMLTLPSRQTLADVVARTFVVNIPPPQPHRAPAAPMYSATDAEFGPRPRRIR